MEPQIIYKFMIIYLQIGCMLKTKRLKPATHTHKDVYLFEGENVPCIPKKTDGNICCFLLEKSDQSALKENTYHCQTQTPC